MSEWRPIETAPRDGRRIIGVFLFWDEEEDAFVPTVGTICWRKEFIKAAPNRWWFEDVNDSHEVEPTHWMPLPEPPEGTGTERESVINSVINDGDDSPTD